MFTTKSLAKIASSIKSDVDSHLERKDELVRGLKGLPYDPVISDILKGAGCLQGLENPFMMASVRVGENNYILKINKDSPDKGSVSIITNNQEISLDKFVTDSISTLLKLNPSVVPREAIYLLQAEIQKGLEHAAQNISDRLSRKEAAA